MKGKKVTAGTQPQSGKRTQKLQLMLSERELKVIDDWRFEHRMPTRAAAIRELLRRGLESKEFSAPEAKDLASGDFSIVEND